jgi:hypothetical protein
MRALHDKMKAVIGCGAGRFRRQIMDMEKQIRNAGRVIDTALDLTSPEKTATLRSAFYVNSLPAYISKMLNVKS